MIWPLPLALTVDRERNIMNFAYMVFESTRDITVEQLNSVLSQFDRPKLVDCTDEVGEDWLLWVVVEDEDRRSKSTLTRLAIHDLVVDSAVDDCRGDGDEE
jgi:hypothetical protein